LENAMSRTDDSWAFFGKVGDPISYKPFNTPDPMGNPRWRALQLPPGLSIDTATGVVSGTPTTPFYLQSHISYSDTFESQLELGAVFSFRISKGEAKPPQVEFSDISLEYGKSYRIPVEVFRGTAGTSGLSLTTPGHVNL
jgi:hypothetical protein